MNPIPLLVLLGLSGSFDDPTTSASHPRAGVCVSDAGPEYTQRPRLYVRETQPERLLRIGDAAPALDVAEWTRRGPVKPFQAGTAYVVVFVPSSTGRTDALFESISKLAEHFAERPVRVLAVAGEERNMNLESWRRKVETISDTIRFPLAWDNSVRSRTAYLAAAGELQPTTVFVIDTQGRLAWYGAPGGTTPILESILAGTWNLETTRKEIESQEDLAWLRIETIRAQRAKDIGRMIKAGERLTTGFDDPPSLEFAEALRDDLMRFASDLLAADSAFNVEKEPRLRALLLASAEHAAKIDHNDKPRSLALLARAQAINRDKSKALRSARKALELAEAMQPPDRDLIDQLTRDVAEFGTH